MIAPTPKIKPTKTRWDDSNPEEEEPTETFGHTFVAHALIH